MILALPLLPPVVGLALLMLRSRPSLLGPAAVGAVLATLGVAIWAAVVEPSLTWRWGALELRLAVEDFARVMVVLVPAVAAPIIACAAATEEEGRLRLLSLMTAFVGAMLLLVIAADFVTLLVGWELVGAVSWALIAHGWRNGENADAAAQAFLTTRLGDLGLYAAAGAAFAATGSFAFRDIGDAGQPELGIIAGGVLLAASAKSAQIPFSPWLFAAMAGPTPVSALLHSATLVAAGAYLLVRLAPSLDAVAWFLPAVTAVGLATALGGGLVALVQTEAKRVLAASTSAQYGLMFLAVGAGSTAAAGAHLVAHAALKSLLFLGAGIAIHAAGSIQLGSMRLGRELPQVALLSGVGALALAAVPPLGGAWTKEQVLAAASHSSAWLTSGVLAAGFLSALYAARYQLLAFGRASAPPAADTPFKYQLRALELGSMALLGAGTLALSAFWWPGAGSVVERAAGGELAESEPWELLASVLTVAAGLGFAWWLFRRQRLETLGAPQALRSAAFDWLGLQTANRVLVARPFFALARACAAVDQRVVDAGIRGAAGLASAVSRLTSTRGEWLVDGLVRALTAATLFTAAGSRIADERGVDGAVEETGSSVGVLGRQSRRLQTGMSHHYYVLAAGGVVVMAVLLILFR